MNDRHCLPTQPRRLPHARTRSTRHARTRAHRAEPVMPPCAPARPKGEAAGPQPQEANMTTSLHINQSGTRRRRL